MKYTCITSMHENHYKHIGGFMIESWKRYWPENVKLIVYAENFTFDSNDDRIKVIDWTENCYNRWEQFSKNTPDGSSQRFGKKGFTFLHGLENIDTEYLIWIDADVLFFDYIQESILDKILPKEKLVALFDCYYQENPSYTEEEYVNNKKRKMFAAESGFVVVNKTHPKFKEYSKNYNELYTSDIKHDTLLSWYDGEVVLSAAREFLDQVEDLSKLRTTNKTQTPLNKTWLHKYMAHIKGKGKKSTSNEELRKIINREF